MPAIALWRHSLGFSGEGLWLDHRIDDTAGCTGGCVGLVVVALFSALIFLLGRSFCF